MVGQLAAGVTYESIVPVQALQQSVQRLRLAFHDLTSLVEHYRRALVELATLHAAHESLQQMRDAETEVDLAGLQRDIPEAFDRILHGAVPLAALVRAVQELSDSPDDEPRGQ
jgi:hypothetical protein